MNYKRATLCLALFAEYIAFAQVGGILSSLCLPRGYQHAILWPEYEKECFSVDFWTGFSRFEAHQAYDSKHGRTKVPLSVLQFNKTEFTFIESLGDQATVFNRNLAPIFAKIKPQFSIDQNSIAFGIDAGVALSDCDDAWTIGARATVPYHLTRVTLQSCCDVEGVTAEEALHGVTYICDQETVTAGVKKLTAQQVCVYRMDLVAALRVDIDNKPLLAQDAINGLKIAAIPVTENGVLNANTAVGPTINKNPVFFMTSSDDSLPPRPWSLLVESQADANAKINPIPALDAAGSNATTDGQRLKAERAVDYAELFTNIALQKKLFVVPATVPNDVVVADADEAVVGSGAKNISEQLNTAIKDSIFSMSAFFSDINMNFDSQRIVGLGDIDTHIYTGKRWWDCLYTEFQFGLSLPTAKHVEDSRVMLFMPNGSNGHVEVKLGAECDYDMTCWLSFRGSAQYAWALSKTEKRNASFKGATVMNLGPQTDAKVSWSYFTGGAHASLFLPCRHAIGLDLGYELYAKRKDHVAFDQMHIQDDSGVLRTLDNDLAQSRSNRIGHTIRSEFFCQVKNMHLFGGFSRLIAGKNIPAGTDLFLGFSVSY